MKHHHRTVTCIAMLVLLVLGLSSCADKAQPSFEQGQAAEAAGKLKEAEDAYGEAVDADAESEHGKKAAERLEAVRATLKKQKQEQEAEAARQVERTKLLASKSPDDWKTLKEKYPDSAEAKEAAKKLAKSASFCADLDTWTTLVESETAALADVLPRYKKRNLLADGAMELIRISSDMHKDCAKRQGMAENAQARLDKHGVLKGEEDLRSELSSAMLKISIVWKKFAKSFAAGTAGFRDLTQYHLYVKEDLVPENEKLLAEVKAGCAKLGPMPDDTPTAPSTPSDAKTKKRDTDGAVMVNVPAGPFLRGSADGEGEDDERPQKQITLKGFWIDRLEVTVAQYKMCVDAKECPAAGAGADCNWGKKDRDDHPINCVIWKEAEGYCKWAGARLPTEAEWEKAARGTDGRTHPWGNDAPSCELAVMPNPKLGCGNKSTWAVGSKPAGASPFGALDMAGNVWEWVADRYDESYYAAAPDTDPLGPENGSARVLRGGAWESHDTLHYRAANRYKFAPTFRFKALGFRCASDAAASPDAGSKAELPTDCFGLCKLFSARRAECADNFVKDLTVSERDRQEIIANHKKNAGGGECPMLCGISGGMDKKIGDWGRCSKEASCEDFHACFTKASR